MKNKLLKLLTLLIVLCFCVGGLFACSDDHVHNFSIVKSDGNKHWYECECGIKFSEEAHKFDKQVLSEEYLASEATCEEKAKYYFSCKCGEKGEETFENGVALGHKYGDFVSNGDGTKTAVCSNGCGKEKTVDEEHICNYKAGETVAPDCENSGYTVYNCACGDSYKSDWVSSLGHSYGDYVSNGNGTHSKTCSRDNSHIYIDDCYASWGNQATCTKKAVCNYCNSEFGDSKPHTYASEYSFDKTHHWKVITCGCAIAPEKEAHTTGGNTCPTCEYPIQSTEGIIYRLSADETYAGVIDYIGSATKVKIPDTYQGKPVKKIYNNAFSSTKITYIEIPNSVTSIGSYAFEYCNSLYSVVIGDSVTSIGNYAFFDCSSLYSIEIPNSVTSIGDYAFSSCDSLYSVVIGDSVTSIGNYAFFDCDSLYSVVIGDSVTSIGGYAFSSCDSLYSVVIGDSVTSIGSYAFRDCSSLYSVVIGDSVTSIGSSAFRGCTSLYSVVIGDSVTSIGISAFEDCSSLYSVVIGDSVTSIGSFAFYCCYSLYSIEIPNSVTSINYYAFDDCSSLTSISYNGTVSEWNKISEGYSWDDNVPATFVQCSDGKVDI